MFYNVTYHRMLHFGSSKHSSNLWGFGLSSKKNKTKRQLNDILFSGGFFYSFTFATFSCIALGNSVAGRAAKKKRKHSQAAVAHLEIASSHAKLISFFRFSMLVKFFVTYLELLLLLGHGCGDPASA